ncbi:Signal transduction histidine kinase [Prevotellaceae bacterium HUN156]|nr:Signal transduction histidine kinase [Prevotellaceae bacterium HUN156]
MNCRLKTLLAVLLLSSASIQAVERNANYKESPKYLALRDSVHHAFNDADSARFYTSVKKLEAYLLKQKDLHAYYTQRCNEIVFELNRQNIYEAYKLSCDMSRELTERKLDKEMYMAINMMGHIYNFSGNKESAKKCFWEVIRRMEQEGYSESLPPIYMNLVNIIIEDDPDEALRLIDQAASIARETSPEREFDIETRRTLAYYRKGDMERFLKGYKAYKAGEAKGLSSVHGRTLEVLYLAQQGKTDEAVRLASEKLESDHYSTMAELYAKAGRWKDAYNMLRKDIAESDSVNSIILSSSMQGIQDEVQRYEKDREAALRYVYALIAIACLLLLLVLALFYIVQARRLHMREMKKAYKRALESDKMKTAFIQNVSHEVRTPLNVITGFAQVMANPDNQLSAEERRTMADMMVHNTYRITNMINEVLMISVHESAAERKLTQIVCNDAFSKIVSNFYIGKDKEQAIEMRYESTLDDEFSIESEERVVRLILIQLLDNAVKNTTSGTITLKASITDNQLMLVVEDTGSGVPAHEAEHIFERFVKLDPFMEGLGIGLTFARTMAQRLGGDVKCDTSYQGTGARFVVMIPLT